MLKFVFFSLLLVAGAKRWSVSQRLVFLGSFLLGLSCVGGFHTSCLGFYLGIDYIRYAIIVLRFWITGLVICARQRIYDLKKFPHLFIFINFCLLRSLILRFRGQDYLFFYICFERSLVPTIILILGWGYQPERVQAGVYILFYTLFASLPLLISILSLYKYEGTLLIGWRRIRLRGLTGHIWYFARVVAFIVKLPVFLGHLWLPKAHVEAPVAGSIILAGVLLKLGGYGLLRILPVFSEINKNYIWLWMRLGLVGGRYVSVICIRQRDIKALIAYSSVAHIRLVICGLILGTQWGLNGAVVVILGHGLCASGIFCIANIVYERVGRRSLFIRKGLLGFIPRMALWWFLLRISNMASPPTLRLLGEICLITRILAWSKWRILGLRILSFIRAVYSLYLYSLTQHGKSFRGLYSCCSGKVREYLVLILHWLPLNILILKGILFINYLVSLKKTQVCDTWDKSCILTRYWLAKECYDIPALLTSEGGFWLGFPF